MTRGSIKFQTSALKAGRIGARDAEAAIESMKRLNRAASAAMMEVGVNACTDVTGYGVLGHAMEMAKGSGVNIVIKASQVNTFPGALELIRKRSNRPRTLKSNMDFVIRDVAAAGISEELLMLLFDPQTSGGLLISVAEERAEMLLSMLRDCFVSPSVVGRIVGQEAGWRIRVE